MYSFTTSYFFFCSQCFGCYKELIFGKNNNNHNSFLSSLFFWKNRDDQLENKPRNNTANKYSNNNNKLRNNNLKPRNEPGFFSSIKDDIASLFKPKSNNDKPTIDKIRNTIADFSILPVSVTKPDIKLNNKPNNKIQTKKTVKQTNNNIYNNLNNFSNLSPSNEKIYV